MINIEDSANVIKMRSPKRDQMVAGSSFIVHRDFAHLASNVLESREVNFHAAQLAYATGVSKDESLLRLQKLIRRHAAEWSAFVDKQVGQYSWFKHLIY